MVYIPPGTFWRGSDDGVRCERPRHKCEITKGFYLGVHPVTVGQYRQFVQAQKHDARTHWEAPGFAQNDDHPVVCVSWDDAVACGAWAKLRLPTEAEWEYAGRGAISLPENVDYPKGREYPWGNKVPTKADPMRKTHVWWSSDGTWGSAGGTQPVGGRSDGASPYGVHDMAGNVWEWCADCANEYPPAPYDTTLVVDPTGPAVGSSRVSRGGSWRYSVGRCLCAALRFAFAPGIRLDNLGFRLARGQESAHQPGK
jgi:formylglycine-generating enzyme required for sulfatase activity